MKPSLLAFVIWLAILEGSSASTHPDVKEVSDRLVILKGNIEKGKAGKDATDRDLYHHWDGFLDKEKKFHENYDQWICTENEKELRAMTNEMDLKLKYASDASDLKQEQLDQIKAILHHENFTETALAKHSKDNITDECANLDKYINDANKKAQDEEEQLEKHKQEVSNYKDKIEEHTCPCVWAAWNNWSDCSKTCEAGSRHRTRVVATNVRNVTCVGPDNEPEVCHDHCCPVDCVWAAWEEWENCPSGCPAPGKIQERTRTRKRRTVKYCDGKECEGEDFEKEACTREEEVVKLLQQCKFKKSQLENYLNGCNRQRDQCNSEKKQMEQHCGKRVDKSEQPGTTACLTDNARKPCVFPFEYKGKTYNGCTKDGHDDHQWWCNTNTDDMLGRFGNVVSGGKNWGHCMDLESCPKDQSTTQYGYGGYGGNNGYNG